ncbi:unnamed protein product [Miscanthus lutarioriparius]|uniref:Uncharacterized protein n=1 Tax=Miscanthus lutarioriparius TaxID=422564 RepID=A0A811MKG7_9POAL|nr:unnamed protein product [Miscanthus lutarioriparius]
MALDESFKRPGTVPFKWEVQPGIPKQQQQDPAGTACDVPPATTPRLALPPAARVGALAPASCRRASSSVASAPLSPPPPQPSPSHRRSMSARFATSLALMPLPFTRRGRGGGGGRAGAAKDAAAEFCLLYAENKMV